MKHEDAGGDRDPAPSHVPRTPRQRQPGGSCFEIHVALKQGRTRGAPCCGCFESKVFLAAGAGDRQRRSCGCCSSLGSGCWSVDTASFPKNLHLSGWEGSAALNSVCSNSKQCECESLKGSAHSTASFLILGVFPPPAIKVFPVIVLLGFLSLSADTHFPLSLLWLLSSFSPCQGLEL